MRLPEQIIADILKAQEEQKNLAMKEETLRAELKSVRDHINGFLGD